MSCYPTKGMGFLYILKNEYNPYCEFSKSTFKDKDSEWICKQAHTEKFTCVHNIIKKNMTFKDTDG